MPFGLKVASEVFQEYFFQLFSIPGVEIYVDDILIHGRNKEEHDQRLAKVFEIAKKHNVKFNLSKCQFGLDKVKYLGHEFTKHGISIDAEKIEAITNMPVPKNKKEVQIFLGLITHVGKFINNLSEQTEPLRQLLRKDIIFQWERSQHKSFEYLKTQISNQPILKYFNPKFKTTISVDASKHGVGAVLMQNESPCAYASRALTETQTRYAQIEKELLAICVGVNKFYQYVYGTTFNVETDHKPLISIFKKPLNACPPRLQRMLLSLQKFDINLIYKPGKHLIIADALSRCNLETKVEDSLELEAQVCLIEHSINISDERLKSLQDAINNDEDLKVIRNYIFTKWPNNINKVPINLKPYYKIRSEITVGPNDLIYFNDRVIIPTSWRNKILNDIHIGHLGINKCILKAKHTVYWPNINQQIESLIDRCEVCSRYANSNPKDPMMSHKIFKQPWQKVGIDLYELKGQTYLIVVDYYSKYPEIINLHNNLTTKNIINKLKSIFARHGIPKVVMSDSAKQFLSNEFIGFSKNWNFTSVTSSPHHQQSNGLVERNIQTIKRLIKKCSDNEDDIYMALLSYRNTPTCGPYSPSQMLMSRYLRDNLIFEDKKLKPALIKQQVINTEFETRQHRAEHYYNKKSVRFEKIFHTNQSVWFQYMPGHTWQKGKIIKQIRDRTYLVQKEDGRHIVRNKLYLKSRYDLEQQRQVPSLQSNYIANQILENPQGQISLNPDYGETPLENVSENMTSQLNENEIVPDTDNDLINDELPEQINNQMRVKSQRIQKAPKKLQDYVLN